MPTFRDNLHLGTKDPLIDADSIADRSITNDKLACDSVGSCQIQDGAVTQEKTTGIMPEIHDVRDRLNEHIAERVAIDRDMRRDIAKAVKSVSVNGGGRVLPASDGNVDLQIVIEEGGQPITPPDLTELQNRVSDLEGDMTDVKEDVEDLDTQINGENGIDERVTALEGAQPEQRQRFIPIANILEEGVYVEQTSLAGVTEGTRCDYVWDSLNKRVLLRVLTPEHVQSADYEYYMSWNENPTGIASNDIDKFNDFLYTTTDELLTIWHWSVAAGDIVPTGQASGSDEGSDDEGGITPPWDPDEDPFDPDQDTPDDDYDYESDPAYPEYTEYGAHGDATEYYNWPLVCFNGNIDETITDNTITIESSPSTIEVYEPGERILNKLNLTTDYRGKSLAYTSGNVYFYEDESKFVLKAGDKYYDQWANSNVYNDPETGLARTDTLFSDIRPLTLTEKQERGYTDPEKYSIARRITYIFLEDEMVDLFNQDATNGKPVLIHDDGPALSKWFNANKGSGKVARLRPGAVYFICSKLVNNVKTFLDGTGSKNKNVFDVTSGTTVVGNGATFFIRQTFAGYPTAITGSNDASAGLTVFQLRLLNNIDISGINFMALADRDASAPGTYRKFSSSSSCITAFSTEGTWNASANDYSTWAERITLTGCNFKNISQPYNLKVGTRYVTVKNSNATGVVNQAFGVSHSTYDNLHFKMKKCIGGGMHIFYGGTGTNDVTVSNSSFEMIDPYSEVMITFHASNKQSPTANNQFNVWFKSCTFRSPRIMRGHGSVGGNQIVHFENCTLVKNFETMWNENVAQNSGWLLGIHANTYEFKNCRAEIGLGQFISQKSSSSKLYLYDSTIISSLQTQTDKVLVSAGTIVASGNAIRYPGPYGFTDSNPQEIAVLTPGTETDQGGSYTNDTELMDKLDAIEGSLRTISEILNGSAGGNTEDLPQYASDPSNPTAGDVYYNTTDGNTYQCTQVGYQTRASIRIPNTLSYPFTGEIIFAFKKDSTTIETFTATISAAADQQGVADAILDACVSAGYTHVSTGFKAATWPKGSCSKYTSGTSIFVLISSKALGDFSLSLTSTESNIKITTRQVNGASVEAWGTSQSYYNGHGSDTIWEEIESSTIGLVQLVSNIADRLTTLEGKVGYIGRKTLTAEELEEAGIDADEGAGSSEQEQMGQGG